jgi:hypothetical protein
MAEMDGDRRSFLALPVDRVFKTDGENLAVRFLALTTPLPELWNDADLLVDPSEGRKTVHWCDSSTARVLISSFPCIRTPRVLMVLPSAFDDQLGSLFATENRKWMREVEREGMFDSRPFSTGCSWV